MFSICKTIFEVKKSATGLKFYKPICSLTFVILCIHKITNVRLVIPCQLIHFFADPSPIVMKFGKLGGQQKKLIHTKFQHISTIFNGVRALWRFEEFYRIIWPRGTKLVITRRLIVQISIFWYHFIENTIVFPMIYYEMTLPYIYKVKVNSHDLDLWPNFSKNSSFWIFMKI